MKKVYIVLPVFNRLAATRAFLKSVRKQTYTNYEVVICDDGSSDGTGEYLRENAPWVTLIQGTGNLWWTAGINRCIRNVLSRCEEDDYFLTINNDTYIPPSFLEQKMQRAAEFPSCIIGSACVYMEDPEFIETSGFNMDFQRCVARSLTARGERRGPGHNGVVSVTHLPGKGVLIPAVVFRELGLYDEVALPHYHADTDLTLRATEAGYRVLVDFDSVVYSDINLNNMTIPGQSMTIKDIVKTFRGPYSPNNFRICNSFAKKHFKGRRRFTYLIKTYTKIIGGMTLRYLRSKIRPVNSNDATS